MSMTFSAATPMRAPVPSVKMLQGPPFASEARTIRGRRQQFDRDAFREGAAIRLQQRRSWSAVTAVVSELRFDGAFSADFGAPFSRLLVVLEEGGGRLDMRTDPESRCERSRVPNAIYYIPSGTAVTAHSEDLRYIRYVSLQFDPDTLLALAPRGGNMLLPNWPKMGFVDDQLLGVAKLFAAECAGHKPADRIFGDSLSLSLLCLLGNLDAPVSPMAKGGLSPRQLRTVIGFMEQRFADGIAPADLADLVNLSASHFCRAFKVSTGVPPHSWLTDLRVRKAREWLSDGDRPLAEIALAAGFSDQSHFTRVFARIAGVSPGAWRRRCFTKS